MKKLLLFSILLCSYFSIMGQPFNTNPDPSGPSWWTGDANPIPPAEHALMDVFQLTPESAATDLPDEVYNQEKKYFPPIFTQNGGSCVHASEIGYILTYELNRVRDLTAGGLNANDSKHNVYHPFFTYNFVNEGISQGTNVRSGFNIVQESGCPEYFLYDDPALDGNDKYKYWMTDYYKYNDAFENKIQTSEIIEFDDDYSSLEDLKHWLSDHNEGGDAEGGLAELCIYGGTLTVPTVYGALPPESPHMGEYVVIEWSTNIYSGHSVTIVGYDENVVYDLDGDGDFEMSDNLHEREYGAFLAANSFGTGWGYTNGLFWIPYQLMAEGLQAEGDAYICYVENNYTPELIVKASVEHENRELLQLNVGYALNAEDEEADVVLPFNSFNFQGGENTMRGAYDGSIDIELNFGYHYIDDYFGKIFFNVKESNDNDTLYDGSINQFSIVDYRWGETFELDYGIDIPIQIENGGYPIPAWTNLAIDYDLIPHENPITSNLNLFSNMVSRFTPTVANNATLTVEDSVRIDLYDSEIHINEGSTLTYRG